MIKLVVPKFASEQEEAKWWDAHMDIVESNLSEAMKNGTAGRGIVQRLLHCSGDAQEIKIPLPTADLERARKLCKQKNVECERYLATLLHEAIDREEGALRKGRKKTA